MSDSNSIHVREATADDIDVIVRFNCQLAFETEEKALSEDTVRSGVSNGLRHDEEVTYLLAEVNQRVVGQLMLTREWSDWRDGWIYWIQSVYVDADHRSQGVFRRLTQAAVKRSKHRADVACLRLYVEEENTAAITTYRRLGFHFPGYKVMELPLDD